ncbi:hypothetical protein D3C74_363350 [compost metagenome]
MARKLRLPNGLQHRFKGAVRHGAAVEMNGIIRKDDVLLHMEFNILQAVRSFIIFSPQQVQIIRQPADA